MSSWKISSRLARSDWDILAPVVFGDCSHSISEIWNTIRRPRYGSVRNSLVVLGIHREVSSFQIFEAR